MFIYRLCLQWGPGARAFPNTPLVIGGGGFEFDVLFDKLENCV